MTDPRFALPADDLVDLVDPAAIGDEAAAYLALHRVRFALVLELLDRHLPALPGAERLRLLDVGPGVLTRLLRERHPDVTVDSLGWEDHRFPRRPGDTHHPFDLNDAVEPGEWPVSEPYHGIILGETIEHLHTAPRQVLEMMRSMTRPDGILLVQTPNAAALPKRLRLLVGRNPYERIREDRTNPGHFRESTRDELIADARGAGWRVLEITLRNYFRSGSPRSRAFALLEPLVPPTWRNGLTAVLTPVG